MSSNPARAERRRSVALELALFYAAFFGLVSAGGGGLLYHLVRTHVYEELDQDILKQAEDLAGSLRNRGPTDLLREIAAGVAANGNDDYFARLLDARGRVILGSDTSRWPKLPFDPVAASASREDAFVTVRLPGGRPTARVFTLGVDADRYLQVGVSLSDSEVFLDHLEHYGLIILGSMLTLGTAAGLVLARKAMGGVEAVTRAAARIADGHFSDRVHAGTHGKEIDDLVSTFNRMAERVQTVLQEMRQMNDSIAHDLRSPLTRIRGLAEAAALDPEPGREGAEIAGSIVEECDRLMALINTVLDIAEAEAGVQQSHLETVDLAHLVDQAVELFSGVADEKNIALERGRAESLVLHADRRRLQRALANLIDNAIKYTRPGGRVAVALKQVASVAEISVSDNGPGIAARDLPHVFERFYRGDDSRHLPGNGLGLALALAVAHAHRGDIRVRTGPGGSTLTLRLPIDGSTAG